MRSVGAVIEFRDYSFSYMGGNRAVLDLIDLKIERGEIVILAGPTGCGKSTLLRSINGLIPHMYPGDRKGSVLVDGLDVALTPMSKIAEKVGFVFQNPENQIFMFSVERDIAFALENLAMPRNEIRERVSWAMNLLDIAHLAKTAPHELSDGQKQRVAIAGVLAMKPSVLILDEPTSLLDPKTASQLVSTVNQLHDSLNITIIVVEHRLDLLAGIATRILIMQDGTIRLDGPPREVLSKREAELAGIGIPTVTRLYTLLRQSGLSIGQPPLSPHELAELLRVKPND